MSHSRFLSIQILFNFFDTSVMILMKGSVFYASFSLQMCVFVFPFTQDVFSVTKAFNIQICDQLLYIWFMAGSYISYCLYLCTSTSSLFIVLCIYLSVPLMIHPHLHFPLLLLKIQIHSIRGS